ncbi:phage tail protein [Vibrio fluvialis]|nr:phage tail protein [Vibrio fluvialis]
MAERDELPELAQTPTPWWQDGSTLSDEKREPYFVSNGTFAYFSTLRNWLVFPLQQVDPLTCSEKLLSLKAWDANITRFRGESDTLFRKRVKYAYRNAKDAGSKAGFAAIFERMGVDILNQRERITEADWDVIAIDVPDTTTENDVGLISQLIRQYGRTCRRYEVAIIHPVELTLGAAEFCGDWQTHRTSMDIDYAIDDAMAMTRQATEFNNQLQTFHAVWE